MKTTFLLVPILLLLGCVSDKQLKEKISKIIKEDPKVLVEAIENNPTEFVMALQKAAQKARGEIEKKRAEEETQKLAKYYDEPLKPTVEKDHAVLGDRNAPLVLIEYSDFQCPFCKRGAETVGDLIDKYGDKIQFVYKHLPLSFHKEAMITSQYFEAIRIQDNDKAFKFHDLIFEGENQRKLGRLGEKLLSKLAVKAGADMKKLKKDLNSKTVMDRIKADQAEAAKFGMQGTPGFLINGVPVKGAYPASEFVKHIEELKKRGKVSL